MAPIDTPKQQRPAAESRAILGQNLRILAAEAPSVAALTRDLGINRTQFNRYLSGESFPRPDVLERICAYFDVDARILLEPLDHLRDAATPLFSHPELRDFIGAGQLSPELEQFPSGLYQFSRRSFLDDTRVAIGIVQVYRRDGLTFLRGYEAREAMRLQGLPADPVSREFRGMVLAQEAGVAALISRRGSLTCTLNYLSPVSGFRAGLWVGFVARTMPEPVRGLRMGRMVYEHLGGDARAILGAARRAGLRPETDLPDHHRRLLRLADPLR